MTPASGREFQRRASMVFGTVGTHGAGPVPERGDDMYLYTRQARINSFDGVAWATETAAAVQAATGAESQVWGAVYSAGFGTIAWTSWYEDLVALEAATNAMMGDAAYMAKSAEGSNWIVPGSPVDDSLLELVSGEPDPEANPLYVSAVRASCTGGNMVRGIGLGVEIAQRADAATGATTLFMRNVTGPYGGVAWFTGSEDAAAMQAQQAALAADAGFLELVDTTAGVYVEDVDPAQSVLWRRLG